MVVDVGTARLPVDVGFALSGRVEYERLGPIRCERCIQIVPALLDVAVVVELDAFPLPFVAPGEAFAFLGAELCQRAVDKPAPHGVAAVEGEAAPAPAVIG